MTLIKRFIYIYDVMLYASIQPNIHDDIHVEEEDRDS